jgi:hypothetical protein
VKYWGSIWEISNLRRNFRLPPVDTPLRLGYIAPTTLALVAELVDALVSGTSVARRGGSSPLLGTKCLQKTPHLNWLRGFLFFYPPRNPPF